MLSSLRPFSRTPKSPPSTQGMAMAQGLWSCAACTMVCQAFAATPQNASSSAPPTALICPRCGAKVTARKPGSFSQALAYLVAAAVMYIPANVLPVTVTSSIFDSQTDTIFSGIVFLWLDGSWPLALLVFVASIVVPLFKLVVLGYLLLRVQQRASDDAQHRIRLYRILEAVGRWSMLDVYVITLLAAVVQIQSLANITPGPGAMAFGSVVVLTMLATQCFDPRLIWDANLMHSSASSSSSASASEVSLPALSSPTASSSTAASENHATALPPPLPAGGEAISS